MTEEFRFPIFILASFILYAAIIKISVRDHLQNQNFRIFISGLLVVVIGMVIGKYGNNFGLPWWIYYPLPLILILLFPPFYFKMLKKEILIYVPLTFLSAPLVHVLFSFFVGWKDYMPFIDIPSIWEMI